MNRKLLGCLLLLSIPSLYLIWRQATGFERSTKEALKALEENPRAKPTEKPATFAEARRLREEQAAHEARVDDDAIRALLARNARTLEGKAASQVSDRSAGCRNRGWSETSRDGATAWWRGDFDCFYPGNPVPNKTVITVRLSKRGTTWAVE